MLIKNLKLNDKSYLFQRGSEGEINMIKAANEAMPDIPLDKPEQ